VFMAVQRAAIEVLTGPQDYPAKASAIYRGRRDAWLEAMKPLGYPVDPPKAGMYVWMPLPRTATNAIDWAAEVLQQTGVLVAPGTAFGPAGEGYVRVALCDSEDRLREGAARLVKAGIRY
jgi:LL-diaminopimelate aminotransferase